MNKSLNQNKLEFNFLKGLESYILNNLSSNDDKFNEIIINDWPSKEFILGSLSPSSKNELEENQTSTKINSQGISFLSKNLPNEIPISIDFSIFNLIERIKSKKENIDIEQKKFIKHSYFKEIKIILKDGIYEIDLEDFKKEISFKDKIEIKNIPDWKLNIKVEVKKYSQKNENYNFINIYLINSTKENKKYEGSIFDVKLSCFLKDFDLSAFKYEYDVNGFIEENGSQFITNNCSVIYDNKSKILKTTNFKKFCSEKINPKINLFNLKKTQNISFNFLELASENKFKLFDQMLEIFEEYNNYYTNNIPSNNDKNYNKYKSRTDEFDQILLRIKESIELIKKDKLVERAFDLMQETFHETNKHSYSGWRLFQFVFILLIITDIIKEQNYDKTELLHVDTGGGKSEAYFGVVIFKLFYDRLKGKKFGLTGVTKFPLRMLSIQQLQRIANLFIWAEEIKNKYKIGGESFSLGYFVGNSAEFPKNNIKLYDKLKKGESIEGKIISKCPFCSNKVYLNINKEDDTIVHYCKKCDKKYYFYFSDEEIYRKVPSFIISTVDKFASIAFNRRFRGLIGGKLQECPKGHGYMPVGDKCDALGGKCGCLGDDLDYTFDTGPSLIIQDEMHLVREGFGTIDSHFESLVETMKKRFTGIGYKNICMTATVSGAEYQIFQLYNKGTRVFPSLSPYEKGINDIFFEKLKDIKQRIYLGLRPNVRENRYAIRKTFRLIAEFISFTEKNKKEYMDIYGLNLDEFNDILSYYKSYLSYHGKKDDIQNMNYYMIHQSDEIELEDKDCDMKIKSITLTGDSSIGKIRDTISDISNKNTINSKELDVVFATNIVSHGVDIEKWNIMCFQGIPRNTAEYIQAVSRIGRKHLGLAIIWFYPNRIRDLSVYENFEEYNQKLEHHVEKVPILRWAKLGFHQTFNSLFCATILNYFSEKEKKPIYSVENVGKLFRETSKKSEENTRELNKFLHDAYCTNKDLSISNYFYKSIPKEVEKRLNKLFDYTGPDIHYFPIALQDSSDPYFSNQMGMRGIQSSLSLVPFTIYLTLIKNYTKRGSKNE